MRIISRRDAAAAGLKRYFTGKPCKNGHVVERYVNTGHCIACQVENHRRRLANDPTYKKRQLEAVKRCQADPAYKKRRNAARRRRYAEDEVYRERRVAQVRKYQEVNGRGEKGGRWLRIADDPPYTGLCDCCGRPQLAGRRLARDHDHETGAFRGWLCFKCNTGIGKLGDTVEGLMHAVEYLRRAGG